jgi:hypothetical protein
MQKTNRFTAFQDSEELAPVMQAAAQKKAAEPKKKVVVKMAKAPVADVEGDEFERVERPQTGAARGGRGGRGGERGGRGGDRPRGDRRGGRGGERGGRGGERGGRPRTAKVEGEEGAVVEGAAKEHVQRTDRKKFEGKAREDAHPMDRKDGTGRGRRGDRKEGEGKANWGNEKKPRAEGEEENKERKPREKREPREPREKREPREPRVVEEVKAEPIVEEEEIGFTLDDFLAQKQAKSQGLAKKNEVRKHEKIDAKNIKESEDVRAQQFQTTYDNQLTSKDTHIKAKGEGAELLGFGSVSYDDDFQVRRGGDRNAPRQAARPQNKGGRKGGKLVVDDNDFPAL